MTPEEALESISAFVGDAQDALAVTVASRLSPWATLLSTVASLRTRDETCAVVTPRLVAAAPGPRALDALTLQEVQDLLYPSSFYCAKAVHLKSIARTILDDFGGEVPETMEGLLTLKGIGRKSAALVLTLGFGKPAVCVDTHVHRLSNRLGFVKTETPAETERALMQVLPERWWIPQNGVLIAFGRSVCHPTSPKCSECPVAASCPRAGVTRSR